MLKHIRTESGILSAAAKVFSLKWASVLSSAKSMFYSIRISGVDLIFIHLYSVVCVCVYFVSWFSSGDKILTNVYGYGHKIIIHKDK